MYTPDERAKFENEPGALLKYRKDTEMSMNALFPTFIADSESQRNTRNFMMQQMKDKLRNPELEAKLIPDWAPGCRRMTPGINYLETLGSSKVRVVFGDINEMTEHGCVVNGEEISLDVLVCATGFDTSFRPRFPIINHKGENLQDLWSQEAKSYFGMAAADFPNYLMFLGPNCPIGNGPLLPAIGKSLTLKELRRDAMLTYLRQNLRQITYSNSSIVGRPRTSRRFPQRSPRLRISFITPTTSWKRPSSLRNVDPGIRAIASAAACRHFGVGAPFTISKPWRSLACRIGTLCTTATCSLGLGTGTVRQRLTSPLTGPIMFENMTIRRR